MIPARVPSRYGQCYTIALSKEQCCVGGTPCISWSTIGSRLARIVDYSSTTQPQARHWTESYKHALLQAWNDPRRQGNRLLAGVRLEQSQVSVPWLSGTTLENNTKPVLRKNNTKNSRCPRRANSAQSLQIFICEALFWWYCVDHDG